MARKDRPASRRLSWWRAAPCVSDLCADGRIRAYTGLRKAELAASRRRGVRAGHWCTERGRPAL